MKNKTFFFVNVDWTRFRSGCAARLRQHRRPSPAFRQGDFSALLTDNQIGTDVLGRPIYEGQIFNPATTRVVNGVPVRDPYPGNVIPADDPLRSKVAAQISPSSWPAGSARISRTTWPATRRATRPGNWTRA